MYLFNNAVRSCSALKKKKKVIVHISCVGFIIAWFNLSEKDIMLKQFWYWCWQSHKRASGSQYPKVCFLTVSTGSLDLNILLSCKIFLIYFYLYSGYISLLCYYYLLILMFFALVFPSYFYFLIYYLSYLLTSFC